MNLVVPDSKSILVVDDSELVRTAFAQLLETEGFEVETARDGYEALEKTRDSSFDLILLDCRMPGLEGPEVARKIREWNGRYREIPIIGISMDSAQRRAQECLDAGMNSFLEKTSDLNQILAVIRRFM